MLPFTIGIILGVFIASAFGWFKYRQVARDLERVRKDRAEIEGEEQRMFAFLRGLGASLSVAGSSKGLHRHIVDGAIEVLGADGGALYALSPDGKQLIPSVYSDDCPPLIELPERIEEQAKTNPKTIGSYLRLRSVSSSEGILSEVLESEEAEKYERLSGHPSFSVKRSHPYHQHTEVMAAPLGYEGKKVGVLLVAVDRRERSFSANDFEVFCSVADQSSFALGNFQIHEVAREKHHLEAELKNASEIQRVLLPEEAPELEDYRFEATNLAAKMVSGDYYDYVPVDENHYGIAIGDVSGKGIAASLVAAMSRSVLRSSASGNLSPSSVLSAVNRIIFPDIREDMFISLAYVLLDKQSDRVLIARAGHPAALQYIVAEDRIVEHKPAGMAAGLDKGGVFERVAKDAEFTMAPGDFLLLYTDGVTEALSQRGAEYGRERMEDVFRRAARGEIGTGVVEALESDLKAFSEGTKQTDDITLIAIQKRGNSLTP